MMLHPKQFDNGLSKGSLIIKLLSTLLEQPGFITSIPSESISARIAMAQTMYLPNKFSQEYCMLEFLAKNKSLTLKDKLKYLKLDSQDLPKPKYLKLSVTLDRELIIQNPDFSKWWTESVKERSLKLWLPSKTESFVSDLSCSNGCARIMGAKSWFSVMNNELELHSKRKLKSYKKISSTSSMSLLPDKTGGDQPNLSEKKPGPNGITKIRLYPNEDQKLKLQEIFNANRWGYNKVIEVVGSGMFDSKIKISDIKKESREYVTKKHMKTKRKKIEDSGLDPELEIPKRMVDMNDECLDSAFRDVFKARTAMLAQSAAKKAKTGKGFFCDRLNYRSKKKSRSETIEIKSRSIKYTLSGNVHEIKFWPKFFKFMGKKKAGIKISEKLPELNYSVRLQRLKTNIYYLCIPTYNPINHLPKIKDNVCAVDPGVRTMLTLYDPKDKQIHMIGNNVDYLFKRSKIIDRLNTKLKDFRGKRNRRYRINKEKHFIHRKIFNLTKDMHHKASKWIASKYRQVIYPNFQTKQMCKRKNRRIGKDTVRRMYLWSHFRFRELLKHKLEMRGGKLIDCTEEYTSKTCTKCGRLNHLLGASKNFTCPSCNFKIDRDVGASRNIYLKNHHLLKPA